jgi:hypothetical protein
MTRNFSGKSMFAVVLTAAALTMAGALPAQAQASPKIPQHELITDTYYANAAHTGGSVGYHSWGDCTDGPVNIVSGTETAYLTASSVPC